MKYKIWNQTKKGGSLRAVSEINAPATMKHWNRQAKKDIKLNRKIEIKTNEKGDVLRYDSIDKFSGDRTIAQLKRKR